MSGRPATPAGPSLGGFGLGRVRGRRAVLVALGALVAAVLVVLAARGLRALPSVQGFVAEYPGDAPLPVDAPVGIPVWLAWQHGLNALFLLFTLRSGWRLHRAERPSVFWTRRNDRLIRTGNAPVRIALNLWSHYIGDTLWALNGALYLVLLFASGHWVRVVPTDWSIVPGAVSVALQYASFDWPVTNGWIDYNALQVLAYFGVVFGLGPVLLLTGLRAAPGSAARLRPLDAVLPLRVTKRIHWWASVLLAVFIAGHVALVLLTGALRNLNHMYAVRDDLSWIGLVVFTASVLGAVVLVLALRPRIVQWVAAHTGTLLVRPPRAPRRSGGSMGH